MGCCLCPTRDLEDYFYKLGLGALSEIVPLCPAGVKMGFAEPASPAGPPEGTALSMFSLTLSLHIPQLTFTGSQSAGASGIAVATHGLLHLLCPRPVALDAKPAEYQTYQRICSRQLLHRGFSTLTRICWMGRLRLREVQSHAQNPVGGVWKEV